MAEKSFKEMIADTVRNGGPIEERMSDHGLERSNPMLYKVHGTLVSLTKSIGPNSNLAKGIYKIEPGMKKELTHMAKLIDELESAWEDMVGELEMIKSHEDK